VRPRRRLFTHSGIVSVDFALSSDQTRDGRLNLRNLAVCRLQRQAWAGTLVLTGNYSHARVGRAMGDGRGGKSAKVQGSHGR